MFGATFFNGVASSSLNEKRLKEAATWIDQGVQNGLPGFGWVKLPDADIGSVLEIAKWLGKFGSIVQIGIGGSSLGNLMLHQALLPPYFNEMDRVERGDVPRFYMADNLDEGENHAIWNRIDPKDTAFIVVSKSGRTLETMGNFLLFWERMTEVLGEEASSRLVVITDAEDGLLRRFVKESGCRSLILPADVGGRYSVLSSVGLLSAAALGIDVEKLLEGASEVREGLFDGKASGDNLAWVMAWNLLYQMETGRSNTVFMPYGDRMERLSEWFCQLWAESLGKEGAGFTPLRALGAVDQHSQLQLYSQGPDDKAYIVLGVKPRGRFAIKGSIIPSLEELSFLDGLTQEDLLDHERRAIVAVLAGENRPVFSMTMDSLDERTLGGLIFFLEYLTALTGRLMDISPFDQPGVELGKKYANGLAGKKEDSCYVNLVQEVEERFRTGRVEI
ncbi:glucose-6-phosphate isomerase [Dethiosulfovibrio sp. F2B]|uniref:glucose-6-phosphate isomerase n=1 Tax=Dethiosulfovibrio faecalis TaxID=2720018 RepID=UPI001F3D766B|nr:glucose-6-phosphate isomerase [Dethiosulfovibrio faecalis]MCF4150839.1 glucose-6-phosphate isomerase [Dethiosulfovibrio faecalis]